MPVVNCGRPARAMAALILCAPGLVAHAQSPSRSPGRALSRAIDSIVTAELTRTSAPGAQVAVRWRGRALTGRGYGVADVARRTPMTAATRVPIGSITKAFTAAAVLRRVGSGELRLDEPIARYFPGRAFDERVTIRHLLNHTSGLRPYEMLIPDVAAFARTRIRADTIASYLSGVPLEFAPGARWSYANSNHHLLGLVLERASGRGYFDVLGTDVLAPAGLRATGPCDPHSRARGPATGHERERGGVEPSTLPSAALSFAAGGLCSTASDVALFLERLPELLGPSTFAAMIEPARLGNGSTHPYGFGVALGELGGRRWFGHGGSLPGFDAFAARYPDDELTVVVVANLRPFDSETLQKRIARRVLGIAEPTVVDVALPLERRAEYVGVYGVGGRSLRVVDVDGRLAVAGPGDFTLAFQGDDTFVAREDPDIRVQFLREGGRVAGMIWTAPGRRIELRRAP